jgi:hypothetical protein
MRSCCWDFLPNATCCGFPNFQAAPFPLSFCRFYSDRSYLSHPPLTSVQLRNCWMQGHWTPCCCVSLPLLYGWRQTQLMHSCGFVTICSRWSIEGFVLWYTTCDTVRSSLRKRYLWRTQSRYLQLHVQDDLFLLSCYASRLLLYI